MQKPAVLVSNATVVILLCPVLSAVALANSSHANDWCLNSARMQHSSTVRAGGNYLAIDPKLRNWLKFSEFAKNWKLRRGTSSSIEQVISMPEYLGIIGMGEVAIPFLIAQLKREGDDPDLWFWALSSITGEDPTSAEDAGNFAKMAHSWIAWAHREGYAG